METGSRKLSSRVRRNPSIPIVWLFPMGRRICLPTVWIWICWGPWCRPLAMPVVVEPDEEWLPNEEEERRKFDASGCGEEEEIGEQSEAASHNGTTLEVSAEKIEKSASAYRVDWIAGQATMARTSGADSLSHGRA